MSLYQAQRDAYQAAGLAHVRSLHLGLLLLELPGLGREINTLSLANDKIGQDCIHDSSAGAGCSIPQGDVIGYYFPSRDCVSEHLSIR